MAGDLSGDGAFPQESVGEKHARLQGENAELRKELRAKGASLAALERKVKLLESQGQITCPDCLRKDMGEPAPAAPPAASAFTGSSKLTSAFSGLSSSISTMWTTKPAEPPQMAAPSRGQYVPPQVNLG
mmetsp:Transcript_35699/g.85924  ORF Transcript_35699/g.85924 Transcript_35699/m.85924 type:complete len:129 (+) Transcript_35699:45-431(+)